MYTRITLRIKKEIEYMKHGKLNSPGWPPAVCLWLAVALGSCTNEAYLDSFPQEGEPVSVIAGIESRTETAAGSTPAADNEYDRSTFINGDKIKIRKMYKDVTTERTYTYNGTAWSVASGTALTLQAGATYQATFPADYNGIETTQETKEEYIKSNKLETGWIRLRNGVLDFTSGSNGVEGSDAAFQHKNAKLTLVFKSTGAGLTGGDLRFQVSAPGLRTNIASDEIVILFRPDANAYTWRGIVYPKNAATDITVALTYQNVSYRAKLTGRGLAPGKHYIDTLTLHNDILVPMGSSITFWSDSTTFTGSLEDTKP